MTNDAQHLPTDYTKVRKKARLRSYLCPGAGFAVIGHARLAIATFLANLFILPAISFASLEPTTLSFAIASAVLVAAALLCIVEQIAINRATIRDSKPIFLDRLIAASSCATWSTTLLAIVIMVSSFGVLQMAGSGMLPTLQDAERLIYRKHVDLRLAKTGRVIVFKTSTASAWGHPGTLVVSRILACPGDKVSIQDGYYVVNGTPTQTTVNPVEQQVVLDIPTSPGALTVPDQSYFVIQDSSLGSLDSRVLSWAHANNIKALQLWYASSRGVFKQVE